MPRTKATHAMVAVTVEGAGSFPVDMLRYDSCVPDGQEDVVKVFAEPGSEGWRRRRVNLRMYAPAGGRVGPTTARWESFMWRVVGAGE
jgi:hypothetical protein